MKLHLSRRALLAATGAVLATACTPGATPRAAVTTQQPAPFADLEAALGGRIGVLALDTGSGQQLGQRADERFAMCSTFKWALVAAVLARADRGELSLAQSVPFGEADLLAYAPAARANVAAGAMTIEALAEAAVTVSDNTAANLLLTKVDGPAGLTRFLRQIGDEVTRLDRNEPTLNTNSPGDRRDTTSPRAMVSSMKAVLMGEVLSASSRDRLMGWLKHCQTGLDRLRAGFPASWIAGDKTGTGERGAANDVAIAWVAGRSPLLVASYLSDSAAPLASLNAAHAEIARRVASWMTQPRLTAGASG